MIFSLISLMLHASEPIETKDFCRLLLAPNQSAIVNQPWLTELGASLARLQPLPQKHYAEQIRLVTADLVAQKRITPEQAETVFAEHLLGSFAPVFLKYTLAELLDREFDEAAIMRFLKNFNHAYSPARQVEFAVSVTRRMLLTLNDDPSLSNARGIDQFVESAQVFGLSEFEYGQFLQTWSFVRESHVQTVVRFILANIVNASHNLEAKVQHQLAQLENMPTDSPSLWRFVGRTQPTKPKPTFETIFAQTLNFKNFPDRIIHVRGINSHPTLFLDRYLNKGARLPATAKDYLAQLEDQPPFARQQILALDLREMNFALLRQVSVGLTDPENQTLARETLAAFGQLDAKVQALRTLLHAECSPTEQASSAAANPLLVAQFVERYATRTKGIKMSNDETKRVASEAFLSVYNELRQENPNQLTTEDFLSIAAGTITQTFTLNFFYPDYGLATGLLGMSRDFDLSDQQIQSLLNLIAGFRVQRYHPTTGLVNEIVAVNRYNEFDEILDKARWGRQAHNRRSIPAATLTPAILSALEEIQIFLGAHEDYRANAADLLPSLSEGASK